MPERTGREIRGFPICLRGEEVEEMVSVRRSLVEPDRFAAKSYRSALGRLKDLRREAPCRRKDLPIPAERLGTVGGHANAMLIVVSENQHGTGCPVISGVDVEFELLLRPLGGQFGNARCGTAADRCQDNEKKGDLAHAPDFTITNPSFSTTGSFSITYRLTGSSSEEQPGSKLRDPAFVAADVDRDPRVNALASPRVTIPVDFLIAVSFIART